MLPLTRNRASKLKITEVSQRGKSLFILYKNSLKLHKYKRFWASIKIVLSLLTMQTLIFQLPLIKKQKASDLMTEVIKNHVRCSLIVVTFLIGNICTLTKMSVHFFAVDYCLLCINFARQLCAKLQTFFFIFRS